MQEKTYKRNSVFGVKFSRAILEISSKLIVKTLQWHLTDFFVNFKFAFAR